MKTKNLKASKADLYFRLTVESMQVSTYSSTVSPTMCEVYNNGLMKAKGFIKYRLHDTGNNPITPANISSFPTLRGDVENYIKDNLKYYIYGETPQYQPGVLPLNITNSLDPATNGAIFIHDRRKVVSSPVDPADSFIMIIYMLCEDEMTVDSSPYMVAYNAKSLVDINGRKFSIAPTSLNNSKVTFSVASFGVSAAHIDMRVIYTGDGSDTDLQELNRLWVFRYNENKLTQERLVRLYQYGYVHEDELLCMVNQSLALAYSDGREDLSFIDIDRNKVQDDSCTNVRFWPDLSTMSGLGYAEPHQIVQNPGPYGNLLYLVGANGPSMTAIGPKSYSNAIWDEARRAGIPFMQIRYNSARSAIDGHYRESKDIASKEYTRRKTRNCNVFYMEDNCGNKMTVQVNWRQAAWDNHSKPFGVVGATQSN